MSPIGNAFRDHPASVGETYSEHLRSALSFSFAMTRAAICCGIHAFLPFMFQKTGSLAIDELHRRMVRDRGTRQAQPATSDPARQQPGVAGARSYSSPSAG